MDDGLCVLNCGKVEAYYFRGRHLQSQQVRRLIQPMTLPLTLLPQQKAICEGQPVYNYKTIIILLVRLKVWKQ